MEIFAHLIFYAYFGTLIFFSVFGVYKLVLLGYYLAKRKAEPKPAGQFAELPHVTVQLPVFNELYVVERLIRSACELDYPNHLLEIQVLDDSTDETVGVARKVVDEMRAIGKNVVYLHRTDRKDFKAGALAEGLKVTKGEFVAIFDADFLPGKNFLKETIHFFSDPKVGMVQSRWGFLNDDQSLLTRIQAVFLNGHFVIEHTSRNRSGAFFNFNGTAGIWRKEAIDSSGGWNGDTLTEDLDLSYRAQLNGWQFVYLKDLVVPSELPLEISGFKGQQFRWVKGMTQVGMKLLPKIWKSNVPLRRKLDSTFHLLSNTGYITTTMMAFLLVPTLFLFDFFFKKWMFLTVFYFLMTNFVAVFLYFIVAEIETGRRGYKKISDVIVLMVVGIGLSINGTKAIFEALLKKQTSFIRTPKYSAVGNTSEKVLLRKYFTKTDKTSFVELLMAVYFLWCSYLVFTTGNIYFVLPLCIFMPGYYYLAYQFIRSKMLIRKAVAPVS